MEVTWPNESLGLMKCHDPVCNCYIDMFQLAVIFLMDVLVWEVLKLMFRKEISQIKERMFGSKGSFKKEPNEV